jgi:cytosine/adenosine deaminase-related metal-dependent hydrolase
VRVVRRFGLSHSLQIDGEAVMTSFRRTPAAWPWIIHAAEGIDAEARDELNTLSAMRCVAGNTVLVHGVALDAQDSSRLLDAGGALVWCPSSNEFLFGTTARVGVFARANRLALGTDSRLSGEGDMLDELRAAAQTRQLSAQALLRAVSLDAAAVLRLPGAGAVAIGQPADLCMLRRVSADPFAAIVQSTRADVRLTMIGGLPLVGDRSMRSVFTAMRQSCVDALVDGAPRLLTRWIARRVQAMVLREPGLEVVS